MSMTQHFQVITNCYDLVASINAMFTKWTVALLSDSLNICHFYARALGAELRGYEVFRCILKKLDLMTSQIFCQFSLWEVMV